MSTPASGIWAPTEPAFGAGMSDLTYACLCLAIVVVVFWAFFYGAFKLAEAIEEQLGWNEVPSVVAAIVLMLLAVAGLGTLL